MSAQFHGVTANQDLSPGLIKKDTKTTSEAIRDLTYNNAGEVQMGMGMLVLSLPFFGFVILAEIAFILSLAYIMYSKNKVKEYTFQKPLSIDENGKRINKGIMLIANDKLDNTGLWFSDDELRTHMLVFGTTGSGKTRFLLGCLYQSMMFGSGCMYVDGKGDNTVWWLVFSFCRKVNKVDDLLVINYLTGEEDITIGGKPSLKRKSNTSNPFAHGSSEQLRSLIVGLMRDGGGDDMWKGRASSMLGSLLKVLTEMRNKGEIDLDIDQIRERMPLDRIIELSQRDNDLSESAIDSIKKYLADLPGYKEDDALMDSVEQKAYEQHGYLTMQLTEVMSDLAETYGHIFSAKLGEVDYKDVVFNRRVLFVILPSLEKDPDALAGLGKLVVAGVRSALAPALGDELEGLKINVIDKKPTKCTVPFLMILDEYGYYAVKGFAVVAAQARSLGVGVIFAGQDYQSLKKASEEEAAATVANTNIKICMKIEDPKETLDIMQQRAGEAYIAKLPGHENSEKSIGALYKEMRNTQIELVKRMSLRDLVAQAPGAAHVMNADKLSRAQLYFADPHEVDEAKLNKFLMISPPGKNIIDKYNNVAQKLNELWENDDIDDSKLAMDEGVSQILKDMTLGLSHKMSHQDSAIFAIGMDEMRAKLKDEIMDAQSIKDNAPEKKDTALSSSDKKEVRTVGAQKLVKSPSDEKLTDNKDKSVNPTPIMMSRDEEEKKEGEEGILAAVDDGEKPSDSVKEQADSFESQFEEFTNNIAEANIKSVSTDGDIITQEDRIKAHPVSRLDELEKMNASKGEDVDEKVSKSKDVISKQVTGFSDYANDPNPSKIDKEELTDSLNTIMKMLSSPQE